MDLIVYPVTLENRQLAGRIEGEQAALGNIIAFPDLLIGATAMHLGFSVATLNRRHFERIPTSKSSHCSHTWPLRLTSVKSKMP